MNTKRRIKYDINGAVNVLVLYSSGFLDTPSNVPKYGIKVMSEPTIINSKYDFPLAARDCAIIPKIINIKLYIKPSTKKFKY